MKKKVNFEITFEDNCNCIDSVMESIRNSLMGHVPFADEVNLYMTIDQDNLDDEELHLDVDLSSPEPAKNGIIADMAFTAMVSAINTIKDMEV